MIKQAEVQNAYLLGRRAAMEKLAQLPTVEGVVQKSKNMPYEQGILSQLEEKFQGPPTPMPYEQGILSQLAEKFQGPPTPKADKSDGPMTEEMLTQILREEGALAPQSSADAIGAQFSDYLNQAGQLMATYEQDPGFQTYVDNMAVMNGFEATPSLPKEKKTLPMSELDKQRTIAQLIGLGGHGLTRDDIHADKLLVNKPNSMSISAFDPMNIATMQNLSRAGMLGGAVGGTAIGGTPLAALTSTAGALGGGMLGGNLGRALGAGIEAYKGTDKGLMNPLTQNLVAGGGALGGLSGGLAAGYLT